jgi:DNA-3-methyladenine glycosylase II
MSELVQITPRGPFSLPAAAGFGFGPNEGRPPAFDGAMRLAFPVDGGRGYAGALLRQPQPGGPVTVALELRDDAPQEAALTQIARVLSLDHDGDSFMALGEGDPVLGALQRAHPGQRPVLFTSPYEAAAWAVISARRPPAQAAGVREDLCRQFGESFELAGVAALAFPQPEHLAQLGDQFPGLNLEKLVRLRNVVAAALAGELDIARLHELGPAQAYTEIQKLRGLGPFYAGLVVLRASGFADAPLLTPEPKVLGNLARFYGLAEPPPLFEQYLATAESWRPFRTWATVLIRLAGDRGTQLPEGL